MATYAIDKKELEKLGVTDFTKYEASELSIWWDKDCLINLIKDECGNLPNEEIEKIYCELYDSIYDNIDCSDINERIAIKINNIIK